MRLRRWVKVVINILIIIILMIIIKDLFKKKEVIITEGKNYICYGSIIQVCAGEDYDVK